MMQLQSAVSCLFLFFSFFFGSHMMTSTHTHMCSNRERAMEDAWEEEYAAELEMLQEAGE